MTEEAVAAPVAEIHGIEDSAEILKFVLHLAKGVAVSLQNGKIEVTDFVNFLSPLSEAGQAFEGISDIPSELRDLTGEEVETLKNILVDEFPVDLEGAEEMINNAFTAACSLLELVKWFKAKVA